MSVNYTSHLNLAPVPQSQPLDARMVPNSAGGYGYVVDEKVALDRFLLLGAEGGTYYASEQKQALLTREPRYVIDRLTAVSVEGRAPKNEPALFVLALALASTDAVTRALAYDALPKVARTGTHLFHLMAMVNPLRGWGRGLKTAVAAFYKAQRDLAYSLVKYQQRDGWSHKDVLRLAHVKPWDDQSATLLKWAAGKGEVLGGLVRAVTVLRDASVPIATKCALIAEYRIPREAIPPELLNERAVWQAMLDAGMPLTSMLRNLGTMSKLGVLTPGSDATTMVTRLLTDAGALKQARVHPASVMLAAATYAQGHGTKSTATWPVVPQITVALADAFLAAFGAVEPLNQRILSCVDISGSMEASVIGTPMQCREAAAALALVDVATEPKAQAMAFGTEAHGLALHGRMTVPDAMRAIGRWHEGTNCAVPMEYARALGLPVDLFVLYSDNESWAGSVHVAEALRNYRQRTGIAAKLAVVNMALSTTTVVDPSDAGSLNVVGFDSGAPQAIRAFARGFGQ
jgi:60 kDa SS-A/Ro ribonucleoprotein